MWNRSVEARGDSLLSSQRMQMTTCVSCWQAHKIKQQQDQRRNHHGPLEGCGKQQGSMRKPGISPARIPEITPSSLHGMTLNTLTLWSKHRQRRVTTKWWETTAVKQESETWSRVKRRRGNSTQELSESAQYCFSNHHIATKLWYAMHLRDMGDCSHIWELQCSLAVYTAFKTTAWMQACKRLRSSSRQLSRCWNQLH